jgi:ubiquinone/menaquinone biosynthesis C-methylase UbiE
MIDHFGLLAPFYDRVIGFKNPETLIRRVELPVEGVVLDAGGGTGRISQFLTRLAGAVIVADLSHGMLSQAQIKTDLVPVCTKVERLPFMDGYFERIVMVDAFHHVIDQQQTIAELWRVLKPGGRVVIEEPDIRSLPVKLIALFEKITLMRSHFMVPEGIADLFSSDAKVEVDLDGNAAWITAKKQTPAA